MKYLRLAIITSVFTIIFLIVSNTNKKVTNHLKTNQNEIDSLKTELYFRDEMIKTFIKNSDADPIGVRVSAENK